MVRGADGPGRDRDRRAGTGEPPPACLPACSPSLSASPPVGLVDESCRLSLKRGVLHRSSRRKPALLCSPPLHSFQYVTFFSHCRRTPKSQVWSRKAIAGAGRSGRGTALHTRVRRPLPAGSFQKALKSQSSPGRAAPAAAYSARSWMDKSLLSLTGRRAEFSYIINVFLFFFFFPKAA